MSKVTILTLLGSLHYYFIFSNSYAFLELNISDAPNFDKSTANYFPIPLEAPVSQINFPEKLIFVKRLLSVLINFLIIIIDAIISIIFQKQHIILIYLFLYR